MRGLKTTKKWDKMKAEESAARIELEASLDSTIADLSSDTIAKIKNSSGYLRDITGTSSDGVFSFDTKQISDLPAGKYQLELWDKAGGLDAIYPSDGMLEIELVANATGQSGSVVTVVQYRDLIERIEALEEGGGGGGTSGGVTTAKVKQLIDGAGHVKSVNGQKPNAQGDVTIEIKSQDDDDKSKRYGPTGYTLDRSSEPWVVHFDNGCSMVSHQFGTTATVMGYGYEFVWRNSLDHWPVPHIVVKTSMGIVTVDKIIADTKPGEFWAENTAITNPVNDKNDFDWEKIFPDAWDKNGLYTARNSALIRDLYQLGAINKGDVQKLIDATTK